MLCQECIKRNECKEICKEVKRYLKENGIYDQDYIRPRMTGGKAWREIPFSALDKKGQRDIENLT